jgi:Holliday junction resolvase
MKKLKPESRIQKEIIDYCKHKGWWVIKTIVTNENGCPDLLICVDGRFIGCEVKAQRCEKNPPACLSQWQKKQIAAIEQSGGVAIITASLEDFQRQLMLHNVYFSKPT